MNAFFQLKPQHYLADTFADFAVQALLDEVRLSPKPALVDARSSGAHQDLTLNLMEQSAESLRNMFVAMSLAAAQHGEISQALREQIGQLGREGEQAMLAVTGGVNTHRGAIWALGLLVTAATLLPQGTSAEEVCLCAGQIAQLEDRAVTAKATLSHGQMVLHKHGKQGAKQQAQQGFPAIRQHALPQLRHTRQRSMREEFARLDALLAIMQHLDDTCVLYRAGLNGLKRMQQGAGQVLALGGYASLAARRELYLLEIDLLRLNASPGGAADLLAATLFVDQVERFQGE
ncbi:triphosphoribosyl-dephospho-CoA synthase MdcB [Acinetobacter brisouii CIP 110357]|uniref:Probable 2-(5''-triphosphoribosyl)-3'-dephosphocoenzyme-A synthase n=1 Tax=Acinetobacter brisouii CIP 110357 TaxID=1341683 RepID=V2UQX2_9GAMM|nr:triphosphoribosyl-dephospho-CoA synthase [Acinetobacter brisouii]ENV47966.1 triphosphoribosyl-dephospho-CoA synthase MdcB [Acinetobacter brisouii ANC 4119]ESK51060.1 triphosphoribosyl-dephospho-CoA synthase MdcB [Acinetobacter brisouii CIP 110357]